MDPKERKDLLNDVGDVVAERLKSHHADNGFVSKRTFDASTQALTKSMGEVTEVVDKVHAEMKVQCRATEALGEITSDLTGITSKLSTDLIAHTAEHAGEEKAEKRIVQEESVKASRWKRNLAVVGATIAVLGFLGTIGVWFVSEVKAAREQSATIVIDKETAKEIVKAVNGREGDDDDEL